MHHDSHGRFVEAEVAPADRLTDLPGDRDRAMAATEPFGTWWSPHHRPHRRPAG